MAGPPIAVERPLVDVGRTIADRMDVVLTVDVDSIPDIDVTPGVGSCAVTAIAQLDIRAMDSRDASRFMQHLLSKS
jgi:hypothetical protein